LFYIDPPYWGTQGYGVEFGLEQYEAIARSAQKIKGNMIISVNDIPEMRQTFGDLQIEVVSLKYSLGNSSLARCELIVRNFT